MKNIPSTINEPSAGDFVQFYDCNTAIKEKDYSGSNPKHYPIGKILSVYDYTSFYGYTDRVCDIEIGDRISKGHFIRNVKKVLKPS